MVRWSFIKRFAPINFEDFIHFAHQFCEMVDSCYESPSKVTVTFYTKLPHSITTIEPGLNEWLAKENEKCELAVVIGLENVTQDLFDQAVNVQLDIRPEDDSQAPEYAFGNLECKGLLNKHLVYHVQPEEVGDVVKRSLLNEQRPSKIRFGVGDGYEHCHSVSVR